MTEPTGRHGRHRTDRRGRRGRRIAAALIGMLFAGTVSYAATNWIVGLNSGSSGQAQSATITNLSITAAASPGPTNTLYPGANGDVVLTISNPNTFPVTVTGLTLPASSKNAAGYSDSGLATAVAGCTVDGGATPSLVAWNGTGAKTLGTAVTVAGNNGTLTVTLTNAAAMGLASPLACAGVYFKMPSLTDVTATGGAATATGGPVTTTLS